MNAIVIDDSSAMRRILRRLLEGIGFEVLEAADGQAGLECLTQNPDQDIVLVDWNMPVMDGLEFVKTVRQNAEFEKLKIMMVTTETEPNRMAKALMSGVDEFVMKPFTSDILLDKLCLLGVTKGASQISRGNP